MSVTCPGNILRAGAILDSKDAFRDHLTSIGANDMHAQYPIGLRVREELDQTFGVEVRFCARVGAEWEGAYFVLCACCIVSLGR